MIMLAVIDHKSDINLEFKLRKKQLILFQEARVSVGNPLNVRNILKDNMNGELS